MKSGAHTQTTYGAGEKACKDKHVRARSGLVPRRDDIIKKRRARRECDGAEQVRIDVHGLVVEVAQGSKAVGEAVRRGAVAAEDVGVVAAPGGQVVPEEKEGSLDFGFEVFCFRDEGVGYGCDGCDGGDGGDGCYGGAASAAPERGVVFFFFGAFGIHGRVRDVKTGIV